MFEIDPIIFDLNDERIHALKNNKIDKSTFLSLRKNDDPWEIRNGTLIYISKEETQRRIIQYTQQYRVGLKKSGGITPTLIYDNSSAFLTVYPELKESLDIAQAAIIKEDCQGCAKNKHLMPVSGRLLSE